MKRLKLLEFIVASDIDRVGKLIVADARVIAFSAFYSG